MIGYTSLVLTVLISTVQFSPGWWKFDNSKASDGIDDRVDFYLYTQRTLGAPVKTRITDTELFGGKINVAKPVKILIHGYMSNKDEFFEKQLEKLAWVRNIWNVFPFLAQKLRIHAYLNEGDFNVINVDWSQDSRSMYPTAKNLVPAVGKVVAKFIDKLVAETGLKAELIHVLGHGLGAHIAGVTGLNIKSGRLMRITGLDPAGPLFSHKDEERLKPSSALFVDVIHTCGKLLGFHGDLGLVDFYSNEGTHGQPGCLFTLGKCSHQRAIELYAESLRNPRGFLARKCDQWTDFIANKCESNPVAFMGEYVGYDARGKYWLRTEKSSPYALGIKGVKHQIITLRFSHFMEVDLANFSFGSVMGLTTTDNT